MSLHSPQTSVPLPPEGHSSGSLWPGPSGGLAAMNTLSAVLPSSVCQEPHPPWSQQPCQGAMSTGILTAVISSHEREWAQLTPTPPSFPRQRPTPHDGGRHVSLECRAQSPRCLPLGPPGSLPPSKTPGVFWGFILVVSSPSPLRLNLLIILQPRVSGSLLAALQLQTNFTSPMSCSRPRRRLMTGSGRGRHLPWLALSWRWTSHQTP